MLEYKISLDSNNTQEPIKIISLDVSSDMLMLSGVTYASEHLDTLSTVTVNNASFDDPCECEFTCQNHQRQGVVFIEGDKYDVLSASSVEHPFVEGSGTTWEYIDFQHNYYYVYSDEDGNKFVDIPYIVGNDGEINTGYTTFAVESNQVSLNYGLWIDDGIIIYKDDTYIVDYEYTDETHDFALKIEEASNPLFAEDLQVDNITLTHFDVRARYDVTYFWIQIDIEQQYSFKEITCGSYSLLLNLNDDVKKCVNLGTEDIPIWGIKEISATTTDPSSAISAVCYVSGVGLDESGTCMSGDAFVNQSLDDLINEFSTFWTYLPDDATHTPFPLNIDLHSTNYGRYLLVNANSSSMLDSNTKVTFKDNQESIKIDLECKADKASLEDYIIYKNRTYYRQEHLCDQVNINDELFDVEYEILSSIPVSNDTVAHVNIYGTIIDMYVQDDGTMLEKRDSQILSGDPTNPDFVFPKYEIVQRDGIKMGDENYPIIDIDDTDISGVTSPSYVEISKPTEYPFKVIDTYGSNIMVMIPDMELNVSSALSITEIHEIQEHVCYDVYENQSDFSLYYLNHIFANHELETGLGYISSGIASSTVDYYNLLGNLTIYGRGHSIALNIPLHMKPANNILLDDIQYDQFYETNKSNVINAYVDMEKDVYYPMYPEKNGNKYVFKNGYPHMLPVYEIQANLHFRTRDLDNWKVIDDYTDSNMSNWFITDYEPYKSLLSSRPDEVANASDLLGLLNFTNNDVFYQKKKIEKSFLRFSIYDSPDPQTQTLLDTSTIWMDETYAYKRYISNTKRFDDLEFNNILTETTSHSIGVFSEPYSGSIYTLVDNNRLSSRFSIKNKYETDASSEGFYMYIFKEYTKNMHPVPLYMKVDFNHAGIGQTIPFIIPMKWKINADGSCVSTSKINLDDENDIKKLKKGYALDDIYMQTYIPLYCAYDKANHQYFYFFDERYVTNNDGIITLNLFELKVTDVTAYNSKHKFIIADSDVIDDLIK